MFDVSTATATGTPAGATAAGAAVSSSATLHVTVACCRIVLSTSLGLVSSTVYTFGVTATNDVGNSSTTFSPPAALGNRTANPVSAPTVLTTANQSDTVTVVWSTIVGSQRGSSPVFQYRVFGSSVNTSDSDSDNRTVTVPSTGASQLSTVFDRLLGGTTYCFVVVAVSAQGFSNSSAPSCVTTPVYLPVSPRNVTATGVVLSSTAAVYIVSWSPPPYTGIGLPISHYTVFANFSDSEVSSSNGSTAGSASGIPVYGDLQPLATVSGELLVVQAFRLCLLRCDFKLPHTVAFPQAPYLLLAVLTRHRCGLL